jgi:hypothetical protein
MSGREFLSNASSKVKLPLSASRLRLTLCFRVSMNGNHVNPTWWLVHFLLSAENVFRNVFLLMLGTVLGCSYSGYAPSWTLCWTRERVTVFLAMHRRLLAMNASPQDGSGSHAPIPPSIAACFNMFFSGVVRCASPP